MTWNDELLDRLAAQIPCGYHPTGPAASEPTALAALALSASGRLVAARKALDWLAAAQRADGSVGSADDESSPGWPTGWCVLAELNMKRGGSHKGDLPPGNKFNIGRAVEWMLKTKGESQPRTSNIGHDSSLVGWPWVAGTHSWVEPTAISILALKATGHGDNQRAREAASLLVDRLLSGGGCNYGNTIVLGQELRPHVEPTGVAMLALAGEPDVDRRIGASLEYLTASISQATTAISMSYGLLGLAANGRFPAAAPQWLEAAYRRVIARDGAAYKLALLGLAALGKQSPLVTLPKLGEEEEGARGQGTGARELRSGEWHV